MDDINNLNYLSSFSRRNSYVTNAADIISPSIKKQLKEYDSDSENESDTEKLEEFSDQDTETSENSDDSEHLKSNAYSYVPEEFEALSFSDDDEEEEDEDNEYSNEVDEEQNEDKEEYEDNIQDLDTDRSENEQNDLDYSTQVPPLNLEDLNNNNSKTKVKNESNAKTDSIYLNKVFSDLEKNLSDVRIEYQVSLSNSAIESSVRRKNCRLSHSNSISSTNFNQNQTNINNDSNINNTKKENNNVDNTKKDNLVDNIGNDNNKDNDEENNEENENNNNMNNINNSNTNNNSKLNLNQRDSNEFDLNKWFNELPIGLKNFIELESSTIEHEINQSIDHSEQTIQQKYKLRNMDNRNMYLQNITSPLKKQTQESIVYTDDSENEEEKKIGYIDILKKDYIEPIKDVFNEDIKNGFKNDLKNFKNDLVELYNKSPKIFQDFMNNSDTLDKFKLNNDPESNENHKESEEEEENNKERINNLNLYYLETKRDNEYIDNNNNNKIIKTIDKVQYNNESIELEKETILKPKKDINKLTQNLDNCKVYDIFDKYECFDITDQPKLTHVSSFDINRNNQDLNLNNDNKINEEEDDEDEDNEKKVIKSIGDYNIGFLSNLSRVNEKYQLLKEYQINSNLIKPWFLNPINEKLQSQLMCNQNQSESDRYNRNKKDNKYIINNNNNENIKYIINKENENIKYIIDGSNNDSNNIKSKNQDHEKYTTLYELENYYNNVDLDHNDSDRNKFYDPILHFKNYEDKKKKSINHTDWATFGRPLVKRIH